MTVADGTLGDQPVDQGGSGAAGLDLGAFTAFLYGFNERAQRHAERAGFVTRHVSEHGGDYAETLRRWRARYERDGVLGLHDGRRGQPSRRKAPGAVRGHLAERERHRRRALAGYHRALSASGTVILAEPGAALPLLTEAVRRLAAPSDVAARTARTAALHRARRAEWTATIEAQRGWKTIGFAEAAAAVAEVLDESTVVVNEYPLDRRFIGFEREVKYAKAAEKRIAGDPRQLGGKFTHRGILFNVSGPSDLRLAEVRAGSFATCASSTGGTRARTPTSAPTTTATSATARR